MFNFSIVHSIDGRDGENLMKLVEYDEKKLNLIDVKNNNKSFEAN